uniref:B-cell receptor CD22 n=1 Tax=Chrysemys picta bellii TaxID=8478 RepID=A0A8C3F5F4_CHRPI
MCAAAQPVGRVPQLAGAGRWSDLRFLSLAGAYAQEWGVTLAPGPQAGWVGSCVTIPCSFTYPAGWNVRTVIWFWTRDRDHRDTDPIVYHSVETRVHADFKGRARYLGDLQHNCSLRVVGLRLSDNGTYRFRFYTARYGKSDTWLGQPGLQLNVTGNQVPSNPALPVSQANFCCSPPLPPALIVPPSRVPRLGSSGLLSPKPRVQILPAIPMPPYLFWPPGATWVRPCPLPAALDPFPLWPRSPPVSLRSRPMSPSHPTDAPKGVHVTAAPGTSPQEGESVTLTCNYTSSLPAPTSYAWYRGSHQLEGSQQEMVLKSIAVEQAGEYRCEADNGISHSRICSRSNRNEFRGVLGPVSPSWSFCP